MKCLIISLVFLFFSAPLEAAPLAAPFQAKALLGNAPQKIFFAGVANEIILRNNIAELGRALLPVKKISLSRDDIFSIMRHESYIWFWRPRLSIVKTKNFELNIAGDGGTPGFATKF